MIESMPNHTVIPRNLLIFPGKRNFPNTRWKRNAHVIHRPNDLWRISTEREGSVETMFWQSKWKRAKSSVEILSWKHNGAVTVEPKLCCKVVNLRFNLPTKTIHETTSLLQVTVIIFRFEDIREKRLLFLKKSVA